jgi:site-specific DNA-cytosine methylase
MEEIGYTCWWFRLAAENLGAPHERERVWILCHRNDAEDSRDFGAAMTGGLTLPPRCQQEMGKAKERWDYWRDELSRGGFPRMISTPTRTEILEREWDAERFYQTDKGRMRKRCKTETEGSMSWAQEMAARAVRQRNPRLEPTPEACEEMMGYPTSYTDLGHKALEAVAYARILRGIYEIPNWKKRLEALGNAVVPQIPMLFGCFIQQFESQFAPPAQTGNQSSKENKMSKNPSTQITSGSGTGENSLPVEVGTSSAVKGTKKPKGRKRRCHTPRQHKQKGEMISPLSPSPVTELPPDFDFIASKTDDEKIEYIQSVLARSEDEAIAVIAPALRFCGTAGAVVEAYLPIILEVKKHLCRPGRPKVDPATGQRNKTWKEVCKENFDISIRRMQQVLASLKEPKLSGKGGTTSRRPAVDRKEYERARQVAAPARSLAEAVVKQGMADRFPDALEILKLADIPIPDVQPAGDCDGVNHEPDWKGILTELAATLEQYGDRLPLPVINALRCTQELLDEKSNPQAMVNTSPVASIVPQHIDSQSAPFRRCDGEVPREAVGLRPLPNRQEPFSPGMMD